jgi:hypothetical protein
MTSEVVELNAIVEDIGSNLSELTQIGQDGFKVPLVTSPDELAEIVGLPTGPWHPFSQNLIWFCALKTVVYARQMLEEAERIFQQVEDETSARKAQTLVEAFDAEFRPAETAFQVYSQLLGRSSRNGASGQ